eukprot:48761-Eustigmatos_ZCMA.PRE.2
MCARQKWGHIDEVTHGLKQSLELCLVGDELVGQTEAAGVAIRDRGVGLGANVRDVALEPLEQLVQGLARVVVKPGPHVSHDTTLLLHHLIQQVCRVRVRHLLEAVRHATNLKEGEVLALHALGKASDRAAETHVDPACH